MALNVEYAVRETAVNLRRNLLMTTAAVLTVAVSLSLVGGALLIRSAVNNATLAWQGGIEFAIYMDPSASDTQRDAIDAQLQEHPQVESVRFVDQTEAWEEFQAMFRNSPDLLEAVTPEELPTSYRVVPADSDNAEAIEALGSQFRGQPGVYQVVFARDTADAILSVSRALQLGILGVALVLLFAATLLILNTIRLAIFARRREIEVMKLVGATNWFIRVPFMLEGMVHGLAGAAVGFASVALLNNVVDGAVQNNPLFAQFSVAYSAVIGTGALLLAIGAAIGAIGSGVAVTRFLDV